MTSLRIAIHTLGLPITGEDPTTCSLGGSESAVVSMARALARRHHAVEVLANVPRPGRVAGVDYLPASEASGRLADASLDLFLACRHLDVAAGPMRARMLGLWHHDVPTSDLAARWPRAWSRAGFSLFVSRFHRDEYERALPGISSTAWVTSNGVDFDALEAATRGVERAAPPRFVYASRPERGLELLLRQVWPRLRDRLPEAELLVSSYDVAALGVPPELERHFAALTRLAERTPGVRLLGALSRAAFWRQLAAATAVLYPTGFPEVSCMVALEAQAAGVPIVTSDAYALRETVGFAPARVAGRPGSPGYVERFVEQALRLARDAAFRRRAVAAGRRHVSRETHSWDAIAERWSEGLLERFRRRFEGDRAGVLRALTAAGELSAARRLVAATADPGTAFPRADRRRLEQATAPEKTTERPPAEPPPSVDEPVFRIAPRPRLSATLLVRDEADWVGRSIDSFAEAVDEIVVGDTASDGPTCQVLSRLGFVRLSADEARKPGDALPARRVVPIEFVDFAQARNDLARHATGDWIFWQDADEMLVGAPELRRWLDENVFFDAFAVEQRHATFEGRVTPSHPLRCFRRRTGDGPLGWFGCVHELVEHELDRPPQRVLRLPDVWVGHFGYATRAERDTKGRERNFALLVRDRQQNPERMMGFVLGLRECLNVAKYELAAGGEPTERADRHLQMGFEIWRQHVDRFPPRYRAVGFPYSREILAILAAFRLPLQSTGQVPFEADFSFSAARGGLPVDGRDIPRHRVFYADVDELRREFGRRLDRLDDQFGSVTSRPPEDLPPARQELDLPAELFGLVPADGQPGKERRQEEVEEAGEKPGPIAKP